MNISQISETCTGCGACAAVCPVDCIQMQPDAEGFLRPVTDAQVCIGCGRCQEVCTVATPPRLPEGGTLAYAALNTDEPARYNSTSGGIFTLLCHWVLARGGIVFGAAYDDDFNVVHCAVEHPADLSRLQGAKYAQSRLDDTFCQVRACLESGRHVLFSGTPCQVGGLISFLGQHYSNLLLVDLICHGVPSPKVWQHYIAYRSAQDANGSRPTGVSLRSKETGWPGYSIRFDYAGGKVYTAVNSLDPYLRGFVGNLYLRPSCYHCVFKGSARLSDFTLGDYWGVWSQLPEYHDGKGTSLVLLHTEKARAIWQDVSGNCKFCEVDAAAALTENPSALFSPSAKEPRHSFFERYGRQDFSALVGELCPFPAQQKRSFIYRIVKKLWKIISGIRSSV